MKPVDHHLYTLHNISSGLSGLVPRIFSHRKTKRSTPGQDEGPYEERNGSAVGDGQVCLEPEGSQA